MTWEIWQIIILSFINFCAGLCFGFLLKKQLDIFYNVEPYKPILEDDSQCSHKSDGKLYTRIGGCDEKLDVTDCPHLFKNNQKKCKKCGEFYR